MCIRTVMVTVKRFRLRLLVSFHFQFCSCASKSSEPALSTNTDTLQTATVNYHSDNFIFFALAVYYRRSWALELLHRHIITTVTSRETAGVTTV